MTRLRILSDLHLEFGPLALTYCGEDVLILAGDIHLGTRGAEWALVYARKHDVQVIMIAGNHEFYRGEYTAVLHDLKSISKPPLHFLDNSEITVHGVRFVGATLWTDYRLGSADEVDRAGAMIYAARFMNDHHTIRVGDTQFLPIYAQALHARSRIYLRDALLTQPVRTTVVVTHHLPSARSIHQRYTDDPHNPSFASDLDIIVAASGAVLWVHGHTHVSIDYMIGATRVLCNPRGYHPHELNPAFNPDLIMEV